MFSGRSGQAVDELNPRGCRWVCPRAGRFPLFYRYEASLAPAGPLWLRHRAGLGRRRWVPDTGCLGFGSANSPARGFVEFRAVRPCSMGMEVCSVLAGGRPGHRSEIRLPCPSRFVVTLAGGASPGFEWCPGSSVSFRWAAGVRSGLRQGLHGGVRGGLRPELEPSVLGEVAGHPAVRGSVASADSLGVVCGFGLDSCGGCPVAGGGDTWSRRWARHDVDDRHEAHRQWRRAPHSDGDNACVVSRTLGFRCPSS
jgi:hypothetical protein